MEPLGLCPQGTEGRWLFGTGHKSKFASGAIGQRGHVVGGGELLCTDLIERVIAEETHNVWVKEDRGH